MFVGLLLVLFPGAVVVVWVVARPAIELGDLWGWSVVGVVAMGADVLEVP